MPSIKLSRRHLLKRAAVAIALPPLDAMFNAQGTLYAADLKRGQAVARPETRFVLWFNGNGITERYWMPAGTGRDFELTPCLAPLASEIGFNQRAEASHHHLVADAKHDGSIV